MTADVQAASNERWLDLIAGAAFPLNLADEFRALANQRPDTPASIVTRHAKRGAPHQYRSLSFRQCQELATQYARGLQEHGIQRGDTAVMLMKPVLDFIPIFLALWQVGAIPVALDPGAPKEQKLKSIEEIGPKVLIGIPLAHALRLLYPRAFRSITRAVTVGNVGVPGAPSTKSFLRVPANGQVPSISSMTGDTMAIVFTTGSTGSPKGVVYTQGNGAAIIQVMKDALGIRPEEVCLACNPAFVLYFVGAGATVVTPDMDPRYPRDADPGCLLEVIRDQKPTVAFMQIPVIRALARYCAQRGETIPYLRRILTTGASVPIELVEGVHHVLAEPDGDLHIMYGATEALCISYVTGREMVARMRGTAGDRGTYLGRPSSGVRVGIISITNEPIARWSPDIVLPRGQIGEISVAGPVVTPEYKGKPDATAKAKIQDAAGVWHRMGDAGYMDEDGGLWYCGRIADRVETENGFLYSDLVEPVFNRHASISRSALVGIPINGSSRKRPVILAEPRSPDETATAAKEQQLVEELRSLARQHPDACVIEDVLIHKDALPVDVRHGAKIRRDQLARYAAAQMAVNGDKLPAVKTVLFKGHRIAYYEKGQGEPVLFLHNAGNDHHIWEHQLKYFSGKCRVVAADSLGYGRSDTPKVDYSLPLYTEMVATLVDSLGLAPVTIVATCTGAAMALNYALQNPQKLKRLILLHIATEKSVRGGNLERITRMVSGRPARTRLLAPLVNAMLRRGLLHKGIIRSQYGKDFHEDPGFTSHLHSLYSRNGEGSCLIRLFGNWKSFAPLDEITYPSGFPPLHVLWGDENQVIPLARGQELCRQLRPSTFDVIEGGGHLVMREKPEVINEKIEELLQLSPS